MPDPRNSAAATILSSQQPGGGLETSGRSPGSPTEERGILKGPVTTSTPTTSAPAAPTAGATAAATASNPIVVENQKTGNPESEWGIDGAGNSNIEGFATDISINRGQKVEFKINTNRTTTGQSHMKNPVGGSTQRNPCYEQRNAPTRVPLRSGTLDPS